MIAGRRLGAVLAGVFLGGLATTVAADVTLRFVDVARYVDAGGSEADRSRNLAVLERHLREAARRCVSDGHHLSIEVLDVDLAGEVDGSRHNAFELRVLRAETPPRLEFAYVLVDASGKALVQERERISDIEYLTRGARARFARDPLPYERALFERWVARRLCPPPR